MSCIICLEDNEKILPCGHNVHIECVKKAVDALQDIRSQDGYAPIKEATCPVCKKVVPDVKPKTPEPVPDYIEEPYFEDLNETEINMAILALCESIMIELQYGL